jgi:peptidoglycan glycosyltransferase
MKLRENNRLGIMKKNKQWNKRFIYTMGLGGLLLLGTGLWTSKGQSLSVLSLNDKDIFQKTMISQNIGKFVKANRYPAGITFKVEDNLRFAKVNYTFDEELQKEANAMLQKYKPDFGAFVAIDARSGRVLSMASYENGGSDLGNLNLRATFPAASIFKVVTAAAAIDMGKASPNTVIPINGAYHTLYKRNIASMQKNNRWTRYITLREAFAKSVNTFFGKLGLFHIGGSELGIYAQKFQFNRTIAADIPIQVGHTSITEGDDMSIAEAASGFTRDNTMSPIHGALIAAAVANDGIMMEPYLVDSLEDENGLRLYQAQPKVASVPITVDSAREMRILMRETVSAGTSRKTFKRFMKLKKFRTVEVGGKTGSLTGREPRGKYDWFVGYIQVGDHVVAIASLTINEKFWKVKSSYMAGEFFSAYIDSLDDEVVKLPLPSKKRKVVSAR